MDFAFSAILLFLIIVPGLVTRFCYFTHPFANQARSTEFLPEVFWSIFPGIFIHFIYILIIETLTKFKIEFKDFAFLLIGKEDNERLSSIANNIHAELGFILIYFLGLLIISFSVGFTSKWIIRNGKLDRRFYFFRFNNKWYYILSGEILDMDDISHSVSENIGFTGVDVLCKVGNETIIYVGELVHYYLEKDNGLDAVLLRYPFRRNFSDDVSQNTYYSIPGDFLYIPYKEILNINVRYFDLNRRIEPITGMTFA